MSVQMIEQTKGPSLQVMLVTSLPPATKLGKVMFFTPVCDSVHEGGLPQCMLGYHLPGTPLGPGTPPPSRHPRPRVDTPWEQTPLGPGTPQEQTPPQSRACWKIWSTSERYKSYWNAILLLLPFTITFTFNGSFKTKI